MADTNDITPSATTHPDAALLPEPDAELIAACHRIALLVAENHADARLTRSGRAAMCDFAATRAYEKIEGATGLLFALVREMGQAADADLVNEVPGWAISLRFVTRALADEMEELRHALRLGRESTPGEGTP